jgi:predicted phage baseplate assembly protein
MIDDLALAGRDDAVYVLDAEAGTVRFGDGLRGRIPEAGRRVRVEIMRAGGGSGGNLPPGSLKEITDNKSGPRPRLKLQQSIAAEGGEDAETLAQAEQRIPSLYRHRDRSVTEEDYKRLAAETPGVRVGRVEVLPRFKPHQRRSDVPGVVSVMTLPFRSISRAPNPRPDRPFIERVHAYLSTRRPLTTELYVIGCEYIPIALSIGITISDGFGRDTVINEVREAVRSFMWPLVPGGPDGRGWPLGRAVRDREIEVAVARVSGVNGVLGVNLFRRENNDWRKIVAARNAEIAIAKWQLPELLAVVVVADALPPDRVAGLDDSAGGTSGIAVPVVPEIC